MVDLNEIFNLNNFQDKTYAEYLKTFTPKINQILFSFLENEHDSSIEAALIKPFNKFIKNAGKRHRPLLCILGCLAFNGDINKCIHPACSLEFFHNSALIHDDIIDKSEKRHGQKCLHKQLGQELAINVGDYGYYMAEKLIIDSDTLKKDEKIFILKEFTKMALLTIKGQAIDISWSVNNNFNITSEDYLQMAKHKTAYYSCAIPLVIGAVCAGAKQDQIKILREFGIKTGLAFQIQDDLFCLLSDHANEQKDLISDIRDKKRTFVLLKALEIGSVKQRNHLIEILKTTKITKSDIAEYKMVIEQSGALSESINYAKHLSMQAKSLLNQHLKNSSSKKLLLSMADWCKNRLY